jgi:LysR family transcriptional regulator, glycine cleavage system transcriptional activator
VCPPALLETARVQAFREWIVEEARQFRLLYERTPAVCDSESGSDTDAAPAADSLKALP